MVTFDCSASHHDGVTLVTVYLRGLAVPTRVTVRNCLDGPVWPPRTEGVPEAGWTEAGFSGVLAPGSHAFGYATPARPEGPPAELADAVAVPEADPAGERSDRPVDVVRELGDPSPPADAVPTAEQSGSPDTAPGAGAGSQPASDSGRAPDPASGAAGDDGGPGDYGALSRSSDACDGHTAQLPASVGPWLAEMERRTDRAVALADAETLPEATTAVRETGGLTEVRALADAGDEAQLRLVARRARRLADRRAEATIPVETLSTLA
ncbi:DUF7857 domain-containing protein [Haloarcula sediminis]|uniref:DUF7857 domain-containing protein n=1 Tax=Haloarcula sediminis TaxID=3111777 RepID=UPI002D78CEFD|nr:hypothetical protein [Haloarcula sp. CK38]